MAFIVIGTLLLLIGGIGLIVGLANSADSNEDAHFGGFGVFLLCGFGFVILFLACSYNRIGQRDVGVVQSFSGAITGVTGHGNVWVAPWSSVTPVKISLQREDFVLNDNNSAVSSDQQPIYADLTLNYNLDPNPNKVLNLYKTVGPNWKAILIDSRVLQDFKEVTAGFSAKEITTKREQLRAQTKARLTEELGKYDISVVDFFVKNLSYTQSYREAVNAKNIQVQASAQAEAKVAQAQAEARQNVALANGQAQATLVKARAEAKALSVKGNALRTHPEILKLEAIDKLNPNAKVIICTGTGQNNCPSFLGNLDN